MFKADLIKEEGIQSPQCYRFQRAARTDKGVSAARQIVSMKLRTFKIISFIWDFYVKLFNLFSADDVDIASVI